MHSSSPIYPPLLLLLDDHLDESTINFLLREKDRLRRYGYRKLCIELPDNTTLDEYVVLIENNLAINRIIIKRLYFHFQTLAQADDATKKYFSLCQTDPGIDSLYNERVRTMTMLHDLVSRNIIDEKIVDVFQSYFRVRTLVGFLQSVRSSFDVMLIDMPDNNPSPEMNSLRDQYSITTHQRWPCARSKVLLRWIKPITRQTLKIVINLWHNPFIQYS